MLPHSLDMPPSLAQAAIGIDVAPAIGSQLVRPPGGVCLGEGPVDRTAVPETTVDKYGNLATAKNNVDPPLYSR
jgi:hypothetical protein